MSVSSDSVSSSPPVYCFCRRPESFGSLVCCDSCSEWYHLNCVALTQAAADSSSSWECQQCRGEPWPADETEFLEEYKFSPDYSHQLDMRILQLQAQILQATEQTNKPRIIQDKDKKRKSYGSSSSSSSSSGPLQYSYGRGFLGSCGVCWKSSKFPTMECISCHVEFHPKCVGRDPESARFLRYYRCESCLGDPSISRSLVYCHCARPDDGSSLLISCDRCEEWHHANCVGLGGVSSREAESLKFTCPRCIEETGGSAKAAPLKKQKSSGGGGELFCLCRSAFHPSRPMIRCTFPSGCSHGEWFHPECLGESSNVDKENFLCVECKILMEEKNLSKLKHELTALKQEEQINAGDSAPPGPRGGSNALYCLCRSPDDGVRSMVQCSQCADYFHHTCVGLQPFEPCPFYQCPRCTKKNSKI